MAEGPWIALIGTLDTKSAEIAYVRDRLRALGTRPIVIDTGILGEPAGIVPDVSHAEVAAAAGDELDGVRGAGSRGAAVERMLAGRARRLPAAVRRGPARRRALPRRRRGRPDGRRRDARAARRRPEADRHAERLGPARVRPVHGRDGHDGHALRGRHPRAAPDLARDLRQRRRGGRGHGARRRRRGRRPRRAHRRRDDARPDHAGRDAAARAPARRRARAGDLPRQRRRRPGDGEAGRQRRARRRDRLHALRARQLADGRRPRDRPGAADGRRPHGPAAGDRPRLLRLLQPGRARHRARALPRPQELLPQPGRHARAALGRRRASSSAG